MCSLLSRKMKIAFPIVALIVLTVVDGQQPGDILVAKTGDRQFSTVQAAVDSIPDNSTTPVRIYIKQGTYAEKILVPISKTNVHFIGEDKDKVFLTFDDFAGKPIPGGNGGLITTTTSYSVKIIGNDFYAQDLSFQNSAGNISQAIALFVVADRAAFSNVNILGNQDTLCAHIEASRHSRQYYKNCYIEGTTDYIFGSATALFENCTLLSGKDASITAASTPQGRGFGFVFKNCKLHARAGVTSVYLGRPWRPFAQTVYLHTEMGSFINPAGWNNWENSANELTAFYAEFQTEGVDIFDRVPWSWQLSQDEADRYTNDNVLGGWIPPL